MAHLLQVLLPDLGTLGISLSCILATTILYPLGLTFYRLFFHPLSRFPGPRLAAASYWYEYYFDCRQRGQYVFKIRDLHEQYGPIIRINPEEIHCSDPNFYNEIYTNRGKRDCWGWQRKGFGSDVSTISTVAHDLHRRRRAAWTPVFSKQRIARLRPVIQERVDALLIQIDKHMRNGQVLNLKHAFAAYAADVSSRYFFDVPQCKIESEGFDPEFHDAVQDGFQNVIFINHWPWMMDLMVLMAHYMPPWILKKYFVSSKMTKFVAVLRLLGDQAKTVAAKQKLAEEGDAKHTVFDQILASNLPPEEKSLNRLKQDAQMLILASTLSTSWTVTVATYELIKHPHCLQQLKQELHEAFPGGPETMVDLVKLEHLPYLNAVVQEALRIGVAISHRSARIAPDNAVTYHDPRTDKQWQIPAGTPMSMSHPLLMRDENIFPDAKTFRPERWIENPGLERYQFAFSKGTRGCPAINLATMLVILPIVSIFGRYGSNSYSVPTDIGAIELFETDDGDIEVQADGGVALAKPGTKGVRLLIKQRDSETPTAFASTN